MTTYEDLSPRRNIKVLEANLKKLRSKAITLLEEANYAANRSEEETKIGNPKKVRKATYEAVIASAPDDIRIMANFLRNYYGKQSKYRNTN